MEADGYRIVDGGSVDRDDEDNLVYEYTDWRTDEVLYREKAHPEPWPAGWYHIDAIRDNYDGFVTAESVAGLPHGLVGQISFWVDENEEDARAWLQSGQGGSITITVPAQLFESIG